MEQAVSARGLAYKPGRRTPHFLAKETGLVKKYDDGNIFKNFSECLLSAEEPAAACTVPSAALAELSPCH